MVPRVSVRSSSSITSEFWFFLGISKTFWMVNWCLSVFLEGAQSNEKIKRTNTCGL